MLKIVKVSGLCIALTSISGCASLELLAAGGISYLVTGKGLSDHALSMVMDQDCAFHRFLTDDSLCEEANQSTLLADTSITENQTVDELAANSNLVEPVQPQQELVSIEDGPALSSFEDNAGIFAVAGSFNDLKYAYERSMLFRNYTTHIIENPEHSPTRFRVVIGPLEDKSLVHKITLPGDIAKDTLWVTELCTEDLSPPPCTADGLLAIAAQAERAGI